jgi:putative transposase
MPTTRHKKIRLPPLNYVGQKYHFVTLCTFHRRPLFTAEPLARWIIHELHAESALHCFSVPAYCLMPDHLHALLRGDALTANLLTFLKSFKHKTTFRFRQQSGNSLWQVSFYDHILRPHEDPAAVAWYVWLNPVRKGLATNAFDYPFSGPFPTIPQSQPSPPTPWHPPTPYRLP